MDNPLRPKTPNPNLEPNLNSNSGETPASKEPTREELRAEEQRQAEAREAAERLAAFEIMQEGINKNAPVQDPQSQTSQAQAVLSDDQQKATAEAAKQETSAPETDDIPDKDKAWVDRIEDIIEKDKDKPYQEEIDAEKLHQEYLKKRFNLEVDAEEDKK